MAYQHMHFPALTVEHMAEAKLFPDRKSMMASMQQLRGGTFAELGVALGDFSEFLIETLQPKIFIAFDTFDMHKWPSHWGRSSDELFQGKSHRQFYHDRFSDSATQVVLEEGRGDQTLAGYRNEIFDLIYVDAGHTYEDVKTDLAIARTKIKRGGVIVCNDYIMYDHVLEAEYGVVQAFNELVAETGWQVVGFALQPHMFCDIALRCG